MWPHNIRAENKGRPALAECVSLPLLKLLASQRLVLPLSELPVERRSLNTRFHTICEQPKRSAHSSIAPSTSTPGARRPEKGGPLTQLNVLLQLLQHLLIHIGSDYPRLGCQLASDEREQPDACAELEDPWRTRRRA